MATSKQFKTELEVQQESQRLIEEIMILSAECYTKALSRSIKEGIKRAKARKMEGN